MKISGVIFAGGKASRLDGINKPSLKIGKKSCLERISERLENDCDDIIVSVAKNKQTTDYPAMTTLVDAPSRLGLDGTPNAVLTVLKWATNNGCDALITTTADTPFLPADFTAKLIEAFSNLTITRPIVCSSVSGLHNLHTFWPRQTYQDVISIIEASGLRSIRGVHEALGSAQITFQNKSYDPFFNINTAEDLAVARKLSKDLNL